MVTSLDSLPHVHLNEEHMETPWRYVLTVLSLNKPAWKIKAAKQLRMSQGQAPKTDETPLISAFDTHTD